MSARRVPALVALLLLGLAAPPIARAGAEPPSPASAQDAEARLQAGVALLDRGDSAAALVAFEDALALDPSLVAARLHRALALQALGRHAEAERELAFLSERSPDLAAESLLLRALGRLQVGDVAGSRQFLREVLEVAPESPAAERARGVLEKIDRAKRSGRSRAPWGSVSARFGGEYDSNVTLESGSAAAGISSDQADSRVGWGAGLGVRPLVREWGGLALGYNYGETSHENLKQYDLQTHVVYGALTVAGPLPVSLRFDALGSDVRLDSERYLRSWTARPNVFVPLGGRLGLARVWSEVEQRDYATRPTLSSLERGGTYYRLGAEQYVRVPPIRNALVTWGAVVGRTNTEAARDPLGFEGDYDDRNGLVHASVALPLAGPLDLRIGGSLGRTRYLNHNLFDALTDNGVGTTDPDRRRDNVLQGNAALGWKLSRWVRAELRWNGVRNRSNVDVHDYERHVVGLHFSAERSF